MTYPNSNELAQEALRRDCEQERNERRLRRWHGRHGPNLWFIQAFNEGRQDLIEKVRRQAAGVVA